MTLPDNKHHFSKTDSFYNKFCNSCMTKYMCMYKYLNLNEGESISETEYNIKA